MAIEQRSINKQTAAIMARIVCPEKVGWSAQTARDFLRLRFADEDVDRFHELLGKHYGDTMTADEEIALDSYMFVNCFVELLHERARQSLAQAEAHP
jgi:hypothetical protein